VVLTLPHQRGSCFLHVTIGKKAIETANVQVPCLAYNCWNGLQLKKLKSTVLIAAKMKALMTDTKNAAEKTVSLHGVKGTTAGNMTPLGRFTDDKNVPASTRYAVPEELIHAKHEASGKDADAMHARDRELAKVNEALKKESAAGTSKGDSIPVVTMGPLPIEPGCVDVPGSQQSTLSLLDDSASLHTKVNNRVIHVSTDKVMLEVCASCCIHAYNDSVQSV
jgi:hypothetical protein